MSPQALPSDVVSLADHEALARQRLPADHWAYLCGGAADELTVQANMQAWRSIGLLPRVLRPMDNGHTRVNLLGRPWPTPLLVAPMAYQRLAHPQGEAATALAAAVLGAGMVLSTQSSVPMEEISRLVLAEPGRGPLWFQLYLQQDRGHTLALVQRAEAAGFEALVLTADAPVQGSRDGQRRTGFRLPPQVQAVHLQGLPAPSVGPPPADRHGLCSGLLTSAPTWRDVQWLREHTHLPLIIKGVTHPGDALLAREHGADAIIVSNHGGRTLDTVPATARLLPRVIDALGGTLPVLVDGGLRRGTDVLKALALGAEAVMIGRPVLHGLTNAGAQGVAHVLRLLRDELEMAMALSGCANLPQASKELLDMSEEKYPHQHANAKNSYL